MIRYKVGMYGGKFCPMHQGHYEVLRKAIRYCENVHVFLFIDSDDELDFKDRWFTHPAFRFYQLNKACDELCRICLKDRKKVTVHKIDCNAFRPNGSEDWMMEAEYINYVSGKVDAVFSSEKGYDAFFKQAYPDAEHVLVDPDREIYPISATMLRSIKDDYSQELLRWLI